VLIASLCLAAPAHASKPRLSLEQVDTTRCPARQEVSVHAVGLEFEGTLRPSSPGRYRLIIDGKPLAQRPSRASSFAKTALPLDLALVVQVSGLSDGDLTSVRAGLSQLVRLIPRRSRITIIAYDWQARRLLARGGREAALSSIAALETASIVVDPALVEALTAGLRALPPRAVPGARGLIVVCSDGINRSPKRDLFRALGSKARARMAPIYPVAYSAIDERGPLLNLGEIAKRSRGTFRWASTSASVVGELVNLAREINEQQVLTFDVPGRCARRQRFQLRSDALLSGVVVVEGRRPARRKTARPGWFTLGVAGFIAGVVVLLAGLLLLTRWGLRGSQQRPPRPGPPALDAPVERGADQPLGEGYWLVGAGPRVLRLRFKIPAGRCRLGTDPDCQVRLDPGAEVAPRHAALKLAGDRLTLVEIDPAHPVQVNGRNVDAPTRLADGDMLLLGSVPLLVRRGG